MAIVRKKYKENYTRLHNDAINNPKLSLKAKGLLLFMFSKPDGWNFSINGLKSQLKEGRDAIANILKELEKFKYLVRTEIRTKEGKFIDIQYNLYEEPYTDNPITENPYSVNPIQDIKEVDIKELSKKEKERENKFSKPSQEIICFKNSINTEEEKEKKVAPKKRKENRVFITSERRVLWESWMKYRSEIKKPYKSEITLDKLHAKFDDIRINPTYLEKVVNYSIENGYQGLFWEKFTKEKPKSTLQSNLDNANYVLQDAEERIQQLNNEIKNGL